MQYLFSLTLLVLIASFAIWWTTRDIPTSAPVSPTNTEIQNSITDPIDAAREVKNLIESRGSVSLDLSEQGLTKVPEYVFGRTELESLDLSNNNLTGSLQAEIRHLQSLKVLDMSGNKFTGVPAEVGQLKELEILDLSNNVLTGLPYELGNLSSLKTLDLSGNHYSEEDLSIIKKRLPAATTIVTD